MHSTYSSERQQMSRSTAAQLIRQAPTLDVHLAQLLRRCAHCATVGQLQELFDKYVQRLLPHQGALLLLGRRWGHQLQVTHALPLGYPAGLVRNVSSVSDLGQRRALQAWLANGKPLVVDLPDDQQQVSLLEAEEIERFSLGRIAAHGMLDFERQVGSYMSYCGVEPTWSKPRVAEILQLITPALHLALMQVLSEPQLASDVVRGSAPALSATEYELVTWLARGLTNADIARLRNRSPHTVRNQLSALFSKLGVRNRAEALARAKGLIA
jgi:DNA-binding CsgD family transcriptional regulator